MYKYSYFSHNWVVHRANNKKLIRQLPLMRGTVYDLGCGVRPFEEDVRRYADDYFGVDWSNSLHELSADIVADLNRLLPLRDCVADSVMSLQVLEHLSEPQTFLNESHRILKSGGRLFLAVPFQWRIHEGPWDFFRFTRYGLAHTLGKAGFVDIRIDEVGGFWTMWFVKLNYQLVRAVRGPRALRIFIRFILFPFWYVVQIVGPILDRILPDKSETLGYFVTARRR